MDKNSKPIYQTTTDEGTTIKVQAKLPPLATLQEKVLENFPPGNAEIEENLQAAKDTLEESKAEGNLNERGQTIVKDVEKLIDTTSTALQEKNKDESLQKLFLDTKEGVQKNAPVLQKEGERIQKKGEKLTKEAESELSAQPQELKQDAKELYGYIKNLLWNFVRSDDFRELASDWIGLLQYMSTKEIKQQAKEQKTEEGAIGNVAKAIDEGLEQPTKPVDQNELQQRTEDMFQNLVDRVRSKPEYQDAFRDIFKLFDQIQARVDQVTNELQKEKEKVEQQLDTDPFWKALDDAEEVLCQFTGKSEWEQFKESWTASYKSIKDDPDIRKWFSDLRAFFNDIIENPEGVTDEMYKSRAQELTKRGREISQKEKWSDQFNKLYDQFNVLLENIKNDSTTNEFGERLKKLGKDFAFNKQGYPDLFVMEDSLIQVKNILIPLFRKQLESINIGRIDFINDTYDVRIEDLGFSGSFLPEHIDFAMRNDTHLDTKDSSKDAMRHMLTFQVEKIKPEFRNFKFYYRRKTFPKIEDYGVADMKITGNGGLIRVNWRIDSKAGSKPVAKLTGVTVFIDKLELHIVGEKTKHDIIDKMLAPLVSKNIKNKISASLEDYLRTKLTEVNTQLNSFLQSSPIEAIKEKANEAMQEGYKRVQEQKSVGAV